ncbi:hypothetical protein RZS08_51595, partial [Arthrospira platensis SPKY1]|nr:hypothetical protein [Arthrospira platensis SPKY1]
NHSVDLDENGQPLPNQQINFDDFVQIGDPNPDFNIGITNNFRYGNWDLSILITAQKGGDIFWVDSWALTSNQRSTNGLLSSFENAWQAPLSVNSAGQVIYDPSVANMDNAASPAPLTNPGPRALVSDRQ